MRFSETRIEKITHSDGLIREIHIWEPESPKAILFCIHGGLALGGDYVGIGLHFKKQGFVTVAPDLRGHIQKRTHIKNFSSFVDDTMETLDWVKNEYKELPIIVIGHSMGSVIATMIGVRLKSDNLIKGYIKSSPYYENAVKVSPLLIKLSGFLGKVMAKAKAPTPSLTDSLTRDEEITNRHHQDEKDEIRGSEISMRFAAEILGSQKTVSSIIDQWTQPVLYLIAGHDELADAEYTKEFIKKINPDIVDMEFYPDNYHENFNEINRMEVFKRMSEWIAKLGI